MSVATGNVPRISSRYRGLKSSGRPAFLAERPGADVLYGGPNLLDDPGPLVPEDEGAFGGPVAVRDVEVRAADAARAQPHQVVPHLRQAQLLVSERPARRVEDPRPDDVGLGRQTDGAPVGSPSRACSLARISSPSASTSRERLRR